jgi:hypothetical protein
MKLNSLTEKKLELPGKRITGSLIPQCVATSTYNQFAVNDKGRELLGIGVEKDVDNDKARIFVYDPEGKAENGLRFLLFKGFYGKGELYGAKIGITYGFTASPAWGAIMASNPSLPNPQELKEISPEDMNRVGIFADADRKIAAYKCIMDIVPLYIDVDGNLTVTNNAEGNLDLAYLPFFTTESGERVEVADVQGNPAPVQIFALINPNYVSHTPKIGADDAEEPDELFQVPVEGTVPGEVVVETPVV